MNFTRFMMLMCACILMAQPLHSNTIQNSPCDDIINGGAIEADQALCEAGQTPALLTNVMLPTGTTATLEYLWIKTTISPSMSVANWEIIDNSNTIDYAPGPIDVTTWYRRCVRVEGCIAYTAETNIVQVCIDEGAPTITNDNTSLAVDCTNFNGFVDFSEITFEDDCAGLMTLDTLDNVEELADCVTIYTRTITATDGCGNAASTDLTITVTDNTPPVVELFPPYADLVSGSTITIDCSETVVLDANSVGAFDQCYDNVTVDFSSEVISENCSNGVNFSLVKYLWVASDSCGNSTNFSISVESNDTEAPTFTSTPDTPITVDCTAFTGFGTVTYEDNCSDPELDETETVMQMAACSTLYTKTWLLTDLCGNSTSFTQEITVVDETAPIVDFFPPYQGTADGTIFTTNCEEELEFYEESVGAFDQCFDDVQLDFTKTSALGDCLVDGYIALDTYNWTATDSCGNATSISVLVQTIDDIAPYFIDTPPTPIQVSCDAYDGFGEVTFEDDCTNVTVVESETSEDLATCVTLNTKTWQITDACGNTSTFTQEITVVDEEAPQFTSTPTTPTTVDCTEYMGFGMVEFIDNCGMVDVTESETITTMAGCTTLYAKTWEIMDMCGNVNSFTQEVFTVDETAPVVDFFPPYQGLSDGDVLTADCNSPIVFDVDAVGAFDMCFEGIVVQFDAEENPGNCADDGYLSETIFTWTAADTCGNATVVSIIVQLTDTTAPTFTATPDADVMIDCNDSPVFGMVTYEDDCGNVSVDETNTTTDIDECTMQYTRTWTIVDECGNSDTFTQTITSTDTNGPDISLSGQYSDVESGETLLSDCTNPVIISESTAIITDDCNDVANVTFVENATVGSCIDDGYFLLMECTWIATDNCGNESSFTISVQSVDNTAPTFTSTPDAEVTIECIDFDGDNSFGTVTFEDDCDDDVTLTIEDDAFAIDNCTTNFTRTWTISDDCGNSNSFTQTIISIDNTPPTVTLPAPYADLENGSLLTYTCTEGAIIFDENSALIEDICSSTTVEFNASTIDGDCATDGYFSSTTYKWTATDFCGNMSQFVVIVQAIDETTPIFTSTPATPTTVDCTEYMGFGEVEFEDDCDDLSVAVTEIIIPMAGCTTLYSKTWVLEDACGNVASFTQEVFTVDETAPVIDFFPPYEGLADGETLTADCNTPIIFDENSVGAFDMCFEGVTVDFSSNTVAADCAADGYISQTTYTWVAADTCGNATTVSINVQLTDSTAPSFTATPDEQTNINCTNDVVFGDVEFEDDCTMVSVEETMDETDLGDCTIQYTKTWTITDECGNNDAFTQTITSTDNTGPVITLPAPYNGFSDGETVLSNCDNPIILTESSAMIVDDCNNVASTSFTENAMIGDCLTDGYLLIMECTWSATDDCGNESSFTIFVQSVDYDAPIITTNIDPNTTVSCADFNGFGDITYEDACDNDPTVEITVTEDVVDDCTTIYAQTWTVTDHCGNSSTFTQTITTVDEAAPTISLAGAADGSLITYACDETPIIYTEDSANISDDCAEFEIEFTSNTLTGDCTNDGYISSTTYKWIATDDCGNASQYVVIVQEIDNGAPVFTSTPDAMSTVDCTAYMGFGEVEYSDACGDVELTETESTTQLPDCVTLYSKTWTITDGCGNSSSFTQEISVVDNTPPVVELFPPFTDLESGSVLTLECGVDAPIFFAQNSVGAFDMCFDDVTLDFNINSLSVDCVADGFLTSTEYIWVAADSCGNATTFTITVNEQDTQSPSFVDVVMTDTLACNADFTYQAPVATDLCDFSLEIVADTAVITENCVSLYTINTTAIDDCGNEATVIQTVIIPEDEEAPVFTELFPLHADDCDTPLIITEPTYTDNCDAITLTHQIDTIITAEEIKYSVTWFLEDGCGNMATELQILTIPCDDGFMFMSSNLIENNDGTISIEWESLGERVGGFYIIERSKDGESFERLGDIIGSTGQFEGANYNIIDESPLTGLNYYKVRYLSPFGKLIETEMMMYQNTVEIIDELLVYPNPASDHIVVECTGEMTSDMKITMYRSDAIKILDYVIPENDARGYIKLPALVPGTYYLSIQMEQRRPMYRKVIITQ